MMDKERIAELRVILSGIALTMEAYPSFYMMPGVNKPARILNSVGSKAIRLTLDAIEALTARNNSTCVCCGKTVHLRDQAVGGSRPDQES